MRACHQELFQIWDSLPRSFQLYGLVPQNPWRQLAWEALAALPDLTRDFAFMPPGRCWHVFTDGSCDKPIEPDEALAAWACVPANVGTISAGPLKGLHQTIFGAEITAVLSAIAWAAPFSGDLHLWVDNQNLVDGVRELLLGVCDPYGVDHSDFWLQVDSLLRMSIATVYIHKVASHTAATDSQSPVEDFAREGNDRADFQARLANQTRPRFFTQVWRKYCEYRRVWKGRVALAVAFHSHIAKCDCSITRHHEGVDHEDEEVSHFSECLEKSPNTAQFHVQLLPLRDTNFWFSEHHESHFVSTCHKVVAWLIELDQSASDMRIVSSVEIYV